MIPDQMSAWAIARLPGETDAQTRERVRTEGLPLFCIGTVAPSADEVHTLEDVIDILYTAKAGGYFTSYMDPLLSNLANAERCAEAARGLVVGENVTIDVVNYSDGFRIELKLQKGDADEGGQEES